MEGASFSRSSLFLVMANVVDIGVSFGILNMLARTSLGFPQTGLLIGQVICESIVFPTSEDMLSRAKA